MGYWDVACTGKSHVLYCVRTWSDWIGLEKIARLAES